VFNKTIIAVTAAVAVCCMPVATNVLAADHPGGGHGGGHALSRHAMGGPPGADTVVALMVHDTEVGTTRGLDRSTTLAMATWQRLPRFRRSLCGWFDKWRAGWLLTVIGKFGLRRRSFPE